MLEIIRDEDVILAMVLRSSFASEGVQFFTPNDFSQQLGYMSHEAGHSIKPHVHKMVKREVFLTQEVLFIKGGKVKVTLYSKEKKYLRDLILEKGDFILLVSGGHGFEMLEKTEMIEIKQGPCVSPKADKEVFDGIKNG